MHSPEHRLRVSKNRVRMIKNRVRISKNRVRISKSRVRISKNRVRICKNRVRISKNRGLRLENGDRTSKVQESCMKISARNQIRGRIKTVKNGNIMAEVEVTIEAADITAVITRGSVESLGLTEGDEVTVIVKSTEVMIGK